MQEFDDIYDKEIVKRYHNHEIKRLSSTKRKVDRERKAGVRRSFKLHVRNRFLILLVYYRLYITYTLAGFLLYDITINFGSVSSSVVLFRCWDSVAKGEKFFNVKSIPFSFE